MNGETPTAAKHRQGHWSQFRLRTLLLATSGCGIVLALLAPLIESYRNEWRIYRELSRLPYPIEVALEPKAPAWLRPFGAGRFMQRIVAVQFYDCDDGALALAGRLPAIEYINVRSQRVTDRGLKHLEGCGRLAHLSLLCPNMSDAALESLQPLGKLQSLSLTSPRITNEGLKHLSDLTALPFGHHLNGIGRCSALRCAGVYIATARHQHQYTGRSESNWHRSVDSD